MLDKGYYYPWTSLCHLIGQYFSADPARHPGPVDLLEVVVPRVSTDDLHPADRAKVILVVEPMNLEVGSI